MGLSPFYCLSLRPHLLIDTDCLKLLDYETETDTVGRGAIPCSFYIDYFSLFLWGFAHAILDVLNKHFQELLDITKAHSAFIQAMMYMGYFVMAVPAGLFISRFGYRREWFSGCCCTVSVRCCLFPGNTICHSICSCLPFLSSVVD